MKRLAWRGRGRGGCLFRLMLFLAFIGAAFGLAWMLFLPSVFCGRLRNRTGFDAEVASLAVNPFTGRIVLRGLVVTNPPTFPTPEFLQVSNFEAGIDLWTLFRDTLVINDLTVDVRQLTLLKRSDGRTNADIFCENLADRVPSPAATKSRWLIRRLQLRFDTLTLADHSERKPQIRDYTINLHLRFIAISDVTQLLVPEISRSLITSGAAVGIGAFLPASLSKIIDEAMRGRAGRLKSAVPKRADTFNGFIDKLEEMRKP